MMADPNSMKTKTKTVMGYPKGYTEYQILYKRKIRPGQMGFHANPRRPPTFANRLRMARRFVGLELHGYSDATEVGYQGLMQVFLTYTALEKLGDVLVAPPDNKSIGRIVLRNRCAEYDQSTVAASWQENDPDGDFVSHVAKHCESKKLRTAIDDLVNAEQPNLAILANGIRNLFAHGHLTPSPKKCNPKRIASICDSLSDYLIEVLDEEFYKVVRRYCDDAGIDYETLSSSQ